MEDWTSVEDEPCIYVAPGGPRTPPRIKLRMEIRFPGDGRSVRQWTFSGPLSDAIDAAKAKRREVRWHRSDIRWLQREFDWTYTGGGGKAGGLTLREYVENGVREAPDDAPHYYTPIEDPPRPRGWLREYAARDPVSDRVHAWKTFSRKFGELNDLTIDEFCSRERLQSYADWLARDYDPVSSHETAEGYVGVARSALRAFAEFEGCAHEVKLDADIDSGAFEGSRVHPLRGSEMRSLTAAMIDRVREAPRIDWRRRRAAALMVHMIQRETAARVGEVLALQIGDIRVDPPAVEITRTVDRAGNFKPPKEIQRGEPRPDYIKIAPISDTTLDWIHTWVEDWRALLDLPSVGDEPLLVPHAEGGPLDDETIHTHTSSAAEDASIEATPRQIRNSVITRLREVGCPEDLRRAIVGHSSPGVHDRYDAAAVPERAREYVEELWSAEGDTPEPTTLDEVL